MATKGTNIYQIFQQNLKGKLKKNILLKEYTTFKIGGPAKYMYFYKNNDDFIKAISLACQHQIPFFVLGGGSNVLFSDKGFSGLVIKKEAKANEKKFKIIGNTIYAGAEVRLGELIKASIEAELTGLEWAIGIPGTVGGALRGNAGAFGGEMSQIVSQVKAVCFQGGERKNLILSSEELKFSYRNSFFKKNKNCVIILIKIVLKKGNKEEIKKKIKNILEKRKKRVKLFYPCAGSIFKNPQVNNEKMLKEFKKDTGKESQGKSLPAGYLIDKAGLKGKKIGGAMISEKNANFILNVDNATAEEVIMLISLIKQQVRDKFKIQLEEEIELVGF